MKRHLARLKMLLSKVITQKKYIKAHCTLPPFLCIFNIHCDRNSKCIQFFSEIHRRSGVEIENCGRPNCKYLLSIESIHVKHSISVVKGTQYSAQWSYGSNIFKMN